jgi:2-polyprenyl-6-methoxyphenol hydroxylase-like FAD-dependent oxidoreductase
VWIGYPCQLTARIFLHHSRISFVLRAVSHPVIRLRPTLAAWPNKVRTSIRVHTEKFFETHFHNVCELIPNLTVDFLTHPTGELGTLRCAPWHANGKVMLLGDAAHAIVPFHGQGGELRVRGLLGIEPLPGLL